MKNRIRPVDELKAELKKYMQSGDMRSFLGDLNMRERILLEGHLRKNKDEAAKLFPSRML